MRIARSIEEIRLFRSGMTSVGFVPTMGALHEGHARLIEESVRENEDTVVSIFVNPLQFGKNEDFDEYPRQERTDIEIAEEAGASVVFIPEKKAFLNNFLTNVEPRGAAEGYEGKIRPGHFAGVATIVTKLVNVVMPQTSYFGLKDLQQCAVLRQVFRDLNIDINLKFVETVREESGLALSSRNAYLNSEDRNQAGLIYELITAAAKEIYGGKLPEEACNDARERLFCAEFEVEYLALVNFETFRIATHPDENSRLIVAVKFRDIRLIDNVPIYPMNRE